MTTTDIDIIQSIATTTSVASGSVIAVLNAFVDVIADIDAGKYRSVSSVDQLLTDPTKAKITKVPYRSIATHLGKAFKKLNVLLTKSR